MKVESTILENHEAQLVVWIENEQFDQAKRRAARKISKEISIPGFRPGKAPYEIVLRMVGEKAIIQEALDLLLDEVYPQALQEAKIEPGAPGRLTDFTLSPEVKFTFNVPLEPEVVLPEDYRQLRIPYEPPKVSEEELQDELFRLQLDNAMLETVDRPIEEGDVAHLRISSSDGQTNTISLYVSPQRQNNKAEKKLAESLLGRKAGEEFDLTVTPEENPDLSTEQTWHIAIERISKATLPTLEELAGQMSLTAEQMTEQLREFLERSRREDYDQKYADEVLKTLLERSRFVYSPQLLDERVEKALEDVRQALAANRMDWNSYLSMQGLSEEEYIENKLRPRVKQEFENSLLVGEIWQREQLLLEQEEVLEELNSELERLRLTGIDVRKFARHKENSSMLFDRAVQRASAGKIFRFLIDLASGELERREQEAAQASARPEPATADESIPSATEPQPEAAEEPQAAQE